jgi:hypothetical protein
MQRGKPRHLGSQLQNGPTAVKQLAKLKPAKFSLLDGSRTSCGTLGFASIGLIFRDDNEMCLWDCVCVLAGYFSE